MYTRQTELRKVSQNDVYKLCVILDENNCWKKLMEIIPKQLNAVESSADGALDWNLAAKNGAKYNNDHIRLIETALQQPGDTRTRILFNEWESSGKKNERPTVGVLLQLLTQAELIRAANHVAVELLNELPPRPPASGPGARIPLDSELDAFLNQCSNYRGTDALSNPNNGNSLADNKDIHVKPLIDKNKLLDNMAPVPPPRTGRITRLKQRLERTNREVSTVEAVTTSSQQAIEDCNMPMLTQLMMPSATATSVESNCPQTDSTDLSSAPIPIPMLSMLGESTAISRSINLMEFSKNSHDILHDNTALSMNDLRTDSMPSTSLPEVLKNITLSDDSETTHHNDHDNERNDCNSSIPNLSIFEQPSSNNDSSLTNVTGTSGENSFELSMNELSAASNENIPNLSALQP